MDQNHSTDPNLGPIIIPDDFGLHDFITESNFDQFLELIRSGYDERSTDPAAVADFDGGYVQQQQQQQLMIQDDEVDRLMSVEIDSQFDANEHGLVVGVPQMSMDLFAAFGDNNAAAAAAVVCGDQVNGSFMGDFVPGIVDILGVGEDGHVYDDDDDNNDGNASSGTTTTATTPKKGKSDRSKTIVSERRRRGRMKDNLYALRSLVPSITKMDKASIVGDAVLYLQNLQAKANRLKVEIAELEASAASQGLNGKKPPPVITISTNNCLTPAPRHIKQMDVFQVGEGEFYIKLVSNRGGEIAASLHKAVESLGDAYTVQSSNLSTISDNYVFTFTLHVRDVGGERNLPNLKLLLSGALGGHGFILQLSH